MKTILSIAYFILVATVSAESNNILLLKLSVACQNAQAKFEMCGPNGSLDPSFVTGYIKTINSSLDALVDSGYLVKKNYIIKNPTQMSEKELNDMYNVFRNFINKLSIKYGYYSAKEMVDMGTRQRISVVQKGDIFSVCIRLPKQYMKDFEKNIQPFLTKKTKDQ